ncbi:MAG: glutamyl-tRNA reductase [Crenarchaeota archaeon]|nr:glutamyl-tRNA reductase [Thermoproteota archaeon]
MDSHLIDNLVLLAATHRWVATEDLSQLYVDPSQTYPQVFKLSPSVSEVFIFQTCHRVEYYIYVKSRLDVDNIISLFFERIYNDRLSRHFRTFTGEEAVRHLLRVAAGLESAIIGENDVLGQLERAYDNALRNRYVRDVLKFVIERSIRFGKHVRTVTGISKGVHGYGSLSVRIIERLYGRLNNISILVVGAGDLGTTIVKELKERGAENIILLNRTIERAEQICREINCRYDKLTSENLIKYLENVDVAIMAISSDKPILTRDMLKRVRRKPLIIDLGVPRLVEKEVDAPVIYFDDLTRLAERYNREKIHEIRKVEQLLEEELKNMLNELEKRELKKLVGRYIEFSYNIARRELEKAAEKKVIDPENVEKLDIVIRSIVSKLVRPIIKTIEEREEDQKMRELLRKIIDNIEKEFPDIS